MKDWKTIQLEGRADWIERYGLRPSRARACLHWLTKGRCTRACNWTRWFDHASAWNGPDGRPAVMLTQPYSFEVFYLSLSQALNRYPDTFLRFEREGWHHPNTALVEIWRNEDVYNALRK